MGSQRVAVSDCGAVMELDEVAVASSLPADRVQGGGSDASLPLIVDRVRHFGSSSPDEASDVGSCAFEADEVRRGGGRLVRVSERREQDGERDECEDGSEEDEAPSSPELEWDTGQRHLSLERKVAQV